MTNRLLPLIALLAAASLAGCPPSDDDDSAPTDDDDATADDDDATADDDDVTDDDDATADDDDATDDEVADWSHCPDADAAVGSPDWSGSLTVTEDAVFCAAPAMWADFDAALEGKQLARLVPGDYRYPLEADAEPWFVPSCVWSPDSAATASVGTVDASLQDSWDGQLRFVSGEFPLDDGDRLQLGLQLQQERRQLTVGGEDRFDGPTTLTRCHGDACWDGDDSLLVGCALEVNVCDRLEFDRGWVALDQHHWAGSVGAGFAALQRARGELDGVPFDVSSYWSLTMTYGHHAFSRGAQVDFVPPIGDVCAIRLGEVSEYGAPGASFETLDCAGQVSGALAFVDEHHTWQEGACE